MLVSGTQVPARPEDVGAAPVVVACAGAVPAAPAAVVAALVAAPPAAGDAMELSALARVAFSGASSRMTKYQNALPPTTRSRTAAARPPKSFEREPMSVCSSVCCRTTMPGIP